MLAVATEKPLLLEATVAGPAAELQALLVALADAAALLAAREAPVAVRTAVDGMCARLQAALTAGAVPVAAISAGDVWASVSSLDAAVEQVMLASQAIVHAGDELVVAEADGTLTEPYS
jgi:hypothetical protein